MKIVLAAVFASYSDKRETQAALDSGLLRAPLHQPDTGTELWAVAGGTGTGVGFLSDGASGAFRRDGRWCEQ